MKKILLVCCFFLITVNVFGQQFSQYNTGSLYDSFENPAQRSFIPDTTKNFAFNFLVPNFDANFYITGNVQEALRTRLFSNYYNTANLQVGNNKFNHVDLKANTYSIMFKVFASEKGDQEVGFFANTKTELHGLISDESVAIFNGPLNFPNNTYANVFNDNYFFQVYNQVGFTYREQVTKRFAFGIKISALSGLNYNKIQINQSGITFDNPNDQATLFLQGDNYTSGSSNNSTIIENLGYGFHNPGAAISIGTSYLDENGIKWQGNIKDLGFIHWNNNSSVVSFSSDSVITGISSPNREDNILKQAGNISSANARKTGFTSTTNGLIELSANKTYLFDYDKQFQFSPTLIASKELFYSGFTAALVAPLQYDRYIVTLTSSYNDLKLFNLGGQFMIKSINSEFFIGSERAMPTVHFISTAIHSTGDPNQTQVTTAQKPYTGLDFFIGVSWKFGQLIERRLNTSSVPDGDKGFIGRIWEKLFNKDKNY
jgi:hypothetical protein